MATELLAVGTSETSTADLVVASGATATIGLKGWTDGQARVDIFVKDDGGAYNWIGKLEPHRPAYSIVSPGTYRFTRKPGFVCGVYSA